MRVEINEQLTIYNPTIKILHYCKQYLVIDNPDYIIATKMGRNTRWLEKKLYLYSDLGDKLILPFGCVTDLFRNERFDYELKFHAFIGNKLEGSINLYDYQQRALNALIKGKNGILEASCGAGKTQIGLALIKAIGGKALWLTHTHDLMRQSMERAKMYFKGDFGTITEGKVNIGRDLTFATIQTMRDLDPSIYKNEFDIVVADECHHSTGSPTRIMQFYKVINNLNCRYKYGLSATLSNSNGLIQSMYCLLGNKLHTITTNEIGERIIKAKHTPIMWDKEYNVGDYSGYDGLLDYAKLVNLLSFDSDRNKFIEGKVRDLNAQGLQQLLLCSRVEQIKILAELLKDLDVVAIHGAISNKKRDFNHKIIIATFQLAKEGLDIPTLNAVHFITPQTNRAVVIQSAGRVERNIEGKAQPIIIDYVDEKIPYCLMCYKKRKNILNKR